MGFGAQMPTAAPFYAFFYLMRYKMKTGGNTVSAFAYQMQFEIIPCQSKTEKLRLE